MHDLAIGADPDGADAWSWQDVLAPGVRVGAPPDEFNADGQDWGLPPFVPWRLRAAGYEPLARAAPGAVRATAPGSASTTSWACSACGGSRRGRGAADGGYVRFPGHELLDMLALESVRAGAFVVGEDLGTVEDEVRDALAERDVLVVPAGVVRGPSRRSVAGAGRSPPSPPTTCRRSPACASGADDPDGALGPRLAALPRRHGAARRRRSRRRRRRPPPLATAPSPVVAATLDDALGVADRPNVPGTTTEQPELVDRAPGARSTTSASDGRGRARSLEAMQPATVTSPNGGW